MAVPIRVSSPALIGRGEELQELRRALDEVLAGGSACAVVAGEAGLGKTRLVRELLRRADVELLVGGCVEVGSDVLPSAPSRRPPTGPGSRWRSARRRQLRRCT